MLALLGTGCTRAAPPASPHTPPNIEPGDTPSGNTLAQELKGAVQACREVQASRGIPVGCAVDMVEDLPAMVVRFASVDDAARYGTVVTEHLAGPFCRATSAIEMAAAFVVAIADQTATVFDCQSGRSKTIQMSATESPIERAMQTCEAMNQSSLPVDCKMTRIEEAPALVLAFGTVQLMNEYLAPAQELIMVPFCDATTEARDPGSVLVMVGDNAKTYRCDKKLWSPWSPFRDSRREQTPSVGAGHSIANISTSEL